MPSAPERGSRSDEYAASVIAALPDAVFVLDRELKVVQRGGSRLSLDWFERPETEATDLVGASGLVIARCRAAADGRASAFEHRDERSGRLFHCHAAPRLERGALAGAVLSVRELGAERESERLVALERRLFVQAFSAASIGMAMTSLDATFLRVNERLAQMTGHAADELIGRHLADLLAGEDAAFSHESLRRLAAGELDELDYEGDFMRADGTGFHGALRLGRVSDEQSRPLFFVAHIADVTRRKAIEEALQKVTQRFTSAFESAPLGMALIDRRGKVFQVNRALADITGYSRAQLLEMPLHDLIHPDDLSEAVAMYSAQLLGGKVTTLNGDVRWFDAAGHILWVSVYASAVNGPDGEPDHFVVQVMDTSGSRRLQDRLAYLADHDGLTGLLNRRRFEDELIQHVSRAQRYGEPIALILIDLDRFKQVNDTRGHSVGDALLRHVARTLRMRLRTSDTASRLGGDEFAVLLTHASLAQARRVAEDLAAAVRDDAADGAPAIECTASAGVAVLSDQVESAEELLVAADLAMYRAKEAGGDLVCVHEPGDAPAAKPGAP